MVLSNQTLNKIKIIEFLLSKAVFKGDWLDEFCNEHEHPILLGISQNHEFLLQVLHVSG